MNTSELKVGTRIKFSNDRSWFTVQARNDRFIICNAVQKTNTWHTIIDLEKNIRGDDNMVLHSGYSDREECEARLIEFASGDLEISHRNNVALEIARYCD